jgi:hypothetical protein
MELGDKAGRIALCWPMRRALGRAASIFITASGWLLVGARGALDLIGYSTAPEDLRVAHDRLDQFMGWLLSLPWWAVWGFALISTLWLMWVSWPRPILSPTTNETLPSGLEPKAKTSQDRILNLGEIRSAKDLYQIDIDVQSADYFVFRLKGDADVRFLGAPSNGKLIEFCIDITIIDNDGSIEWPNNMTWEDGSAPILRRRQIYRVLSTDGGQSFLASVQWITLELVVTPTS